jgi:hypothetical protein
MRTVEVSKVWAVKRLGGPNSGWEERNVFSVILELWTVGGVPFAEKIGAVP